MLPHLALVLIVLPFPAFALDVPNCLPPSGVSATTTLADFPAPVRQSLAEHVPNLSAPGTPFNPGDALVFPQVNLDRRLITAFHRGNRWVIAYEAAGRGYHHIVIGYEVADDGNFADITFKKQVLPSQTCGQLVMGLDLVSQVDPAW